MYVIDDLAPVPVSPDCETGLDYGFGAPLNPSDPFEGAAEPFPSALIIPRRDQAGIIETMHRNGTLLSVMAHEAGKPVKFQRKTPLCWGFGTVTGCEYVNLRQNQKYISLSPASVCGPVTNWRYRGGWAKEAIEQIASSGIAPSEMMPDTAMERSRYTPAVQAEAMKRRCQEWWKLTPGHVDPERCRDEVISCLIRMYPVAAELPWWGHLVCFVDPVIVDGKVGVKFENSWDVTWGDNGYGTLTGQRMLPQGAVVPRVMTAV